MEEKTSGAIGEKIKALQNLKSATDITDQASLDYYNKEIARLNLLVQKTGARCTEKDGRWPDQPTCCIVRVR